MLVHEVFSDTVDADLIAAIKQKGTIVIPTLTVLDGYADVFLGRSPAKRYPLDCVDPATRRKLETILPDTLRAKGAAFWSGPGAALRSTAAGNLKRMYSAGVPIAMGTDAGNPGTAHGPGVYAEMEAMQQAGMSPADVFAASTIGAARAMALEKEIGSIEQGKRADLVVFDADPTSDIRNARRIRSVIHNGVMYSRQDLLPRPAPSTSSAADSRDVVRLAANPIVTPASSPTLGGNINGPSLLRVPQWVQRPLGRYYLYFAHHAGKFIRLAYADRLLGPWKVYEPGTLRLEQAPSCYDHVASPDVHVDSVRREILMYFHCPAGSEGKLDIGQQKTFLAVSRDGLRFAADTEPLGPAYFRVFRRGEYYYAVVRGGGILRSRDRRSPFEPGPALIAPDSGRLLRHAAVDLDGDLLRLYYSRIGDRPERILLSEVRLSGDWSSWRVSAPVTVLSPERDYEGADRPLDESRPDEAPGRVRQLRDPAIFREGERTYLLYSVAGESGLAIAELRE